MLSWGVLGYPGVSWGIQTDRIPQVPLPNRPAPFLKEIHVSAEGVTKFLKGLNPSKALGPDELHPRVLKELASELGLMFGSGTFRPKSVSSPRRFAPSRFAPGCFAPTGRFAPWTFRPKISMGVEGGDIYVEIYVYNELYFTLAALNNTDL